MNISLDDFRNVIQDIVKTINDKNIFYVNTSEISDGNMMTDGIHLSIEGLKNLQKH